jgi:hypothetical protein
MKQCWIKDKKVKKSPLESTKTHKGLFKYNHAHDPDTDPHVDPHCFGLSESGRHEMSKNLTLFPLADL